ncbi:hypothetical protein ACT691_07430 [Vibrio metschnikovii]
MFLTRVQDVFLWRMRLRSKVGETQWHYGAEDLPKQQTPGLNNLTTPCVFDYRLAEQDIVGLDCLVESITVGEGTDRTRATSIRIGIK